MSYEKPDKITLGDTPARRRGWAILKAQQEKGELARISNISDEGRGYIYWQVAEWLVNNARVAYRPAHWPQGTKNPVPDAGYQLALTDIGREHVARGL